MSLMPPRTIVGVRHPGTFSRTVFLGRLSELLGRRPFSGSISDMASETLMGRRHSIATAEHTLKIALSALKQGNRRLASSRAVTAVIQAAIASIGASPMVVRRAELIGFEGRRIIQHLVLSRAASLGLYSRFTA